MRKSKIDSANLKAIQVFDEWVTFDYLHGTTNLNKLKRHFTVINRMIQHLYYKLVNFTRIPILTRDTTL